MLDADAGRVAGDGESRIGDVPDIQLRRALIQRRDEVTVLDVMAKRLETDLVGGEHDLGRSQQPPRIVDDAHADERRSVRPARFPGAECRQRCHRTGQQSRGAMVVFGWRRDENCLDAGDAQRNGADQAGGAAADDGHFNCVFSGGHERTARSP